MTTLGFSGGQNPMCFPRYFPYEICWCSQTVPT